MAVALDQGEILKWPLHSISSIEYHHEELGKHTWKMMSDLLVNKKAKLSTRLSFYMGEGKTLSKGHA